MNVCAKTVFAAAAAIALGAGCATPQQYQPYPVGGTPYPLYGDSPVSAQRSEYGVVEAIDVVRDGGTTSGLGAVLGGIAGGVIGHQVGSGRGNTAATIAGAVGGALVGNEVEKARPSDRYRIVVRLDSGTAVAFSEVGEGQLRIGDRVRVVNNRIYRS